MDEQRFADIAAVRFQYAVAGEDPPVVLLPDSGSWRLTFDDMITERVSRLALLAPAGLDVADVWEFRLLRLPLVGELATRHASAASVRHMVSTSFAHPDRVPGEGLFREAVQQLRTGPAAATLRRDLLRVERGVLWSDTERDLDRVRCPTLIVRQTTTGASRSSCSTGSFADCPPQTSTRCPAGALAARRLPRTVLSPG